MGREAGVLGCELDPEADNAAAIRCYEKVGLRVVRMVVAYGDGHRLQLMQPHEP